jgi:hypothetical protein
MRRRLTKRLSWTVLRGTYAGKPIERRPKYWVRRFKGPYEGEPNVTIYNFSACGVWLCVCWEEKV